jgi:hypothetical protein
MNNKIQIQKTLDEMIAHIAEEERLRQFLSNYEITEIDEIHDIRHYQRDSDRKGLIFEVNEKDAEKRSKILIDLRFGQPIINQVYRVLIN